jgi:hypothetical protein
VIHPTLTLSPSQALQQQKLNHKAGSLHNELAAMLLRGDVSGDAVTQLHDRITSARGNADELGAVELQLGLTSMLAKHQRNTAAEQLRPW